MLTKLGTEDNAQGRSASWFSPRLIFGIAAVAFTAAFLGLIAMLGDTRRAIDALTISNSGDSQWSMSQTEVGFLGFKVAIETAIDRRDINALLHVRRSYEQLHARFNRIAQDPSYEPILEAADIRQEHARIVNWLESRRSLFAGTDGQLRDELVTLRAEATEMLPHVRRITLAAPRVFAAVNEENRQAVRSSLIQLSFATLSLFACLIVGLAALVFLLMELSRQKSRVERSVAQMKAIIAGAQDAIIVVDNAGRIVDFNEAAERIYGYQKNEVMLRRFDKCLFTPLQSDDVQNAFELNARSIDTGHAQVNRTFSKKKDGSVFPIELTASAVRGPDGIMHVGFVRDISRERAVESELEQARDKAIAGEKAKARFIAEMSHEMRTPLNGIIATLHLIEQDRLAEDTAHHVDVIGKSADMLLDQVNGVLDLSRLEAEHVVASPEPVNLSSVTADLIDVHSASARLNGNDIELHPDCEQGLVVLADRRLLVQVLTNLIGNAIKFTKDGSITLHARAMTDQGRIEISVMDTGVGIARENLDRIFDEFFTHGADDAAGTGLGLTICKRMIEAMGGEIGVDSSPGAGSRFRIRLPAVNLIAAGEDPPEAQLPTVQQIDETGAKLDVLVVDDNQISRMVACQMVMQCGHSATEVHDGEEAVSAARGAKYDVILMDVSMPGMDGMAAANALRSEPGASPGAVIAAVTAHALPHEVAQFRKAGLRTVLSKPLSISDLADVLNQAQDARAASVADLERGLNLPLFEEAQNRLGVHEVNAIWQDLSSEINSALLCGELARPGQDLGRLSANLHRMGATARLLGASNLQQLLRTAEKTMIDEKSLDRGFQDQLRQCWSATNAAIEAARAA